MQSTDSAISVGSVGVPPGGLSSPILVNSASVGSGGVIDALPRGHGGGSGGFTYGDSVTNLNTEYNATTNPTTPATATEPWVQE